MNNTQLLLTIIGMGLVTFGLRLCFILLSDRIKLPDIVRRGLNYVPTAVLSAIILPDMLIQENKLDLSLGNEYLFAGIVAILAAWLTKNVMITIAIGMAVVWLWPL